MMPVKVIYINNQDLDSIHFNPEFKYFDKTQLVLVVGKAGSGKTKLLRMLQKIYRDGPLINLGLELSKKMIEKEDIDFYNIMDEILGGFRKVYLDNLEILCDPYLNKDPVRELFNLARGRQIVATLPGEVRNEFLYYPRNMRFELNDLKNSFIINLHEG